MTAATAALSLNSTFTTAKLIKPLTYPPFSLRSLFSLQLRGGPRPVTRIAVARGGGRYYRRPSGSRRRQGDAGFVNPDYDPALDLDRIRSDSAILSPDADPPVLRLFVGNDYKKHKYEQQKKKRVQQKRSLANRVDIKEVKMGYNIDSHDYSVRLRAAKRFLNDGDKVKVIVNLKRRENEFKDKAIELLKRFQNDVGELATEESKNFSVRDIFVVLMPNKAVIQKTQEQPKKKEEAAKVPDGEKKEEPAEEVPASV